MNYYTIYHHHRFGHDIYVAVSDHEPTVKEAIETFGIDFERDDEDEWINIDISYLKIVIGE